jgi:hypothetical protein
MLQAEQQHATSTTNVSLDLVQLFKALGGGWELTLPDLAESAEVIRSPIAAKMPADLLPGLVADWHLPNFDRLRPQYRHRLGELPTNARTTVSPCTA